MTIEDFHPHIAGRGPVLVVTYNSDEDRIGDTIEFQGTDYEIVDRESFDYRPFAPGLSA